MTTARGPSGEDPGAREAALLALVADLSSELQPGLDSGRLGLDSVLDRDLGLDSLARMELVTRLEEHFSVALAEQQAAAAETPRDLLLLLERAKPRTPDEVARGMQLPEPLPVLPGGGEAPEEASTLLEVLDWHAATHPERTHILLYGDDPGAPAEEIRYGALVAAAEEVAAGLRTGGLEAGESVAIMLPTAADYFYSFYGVLLAGGVPVPLYPPVRPSQLEDHLRRQARILANCRAPVLVTVPEAKSVARLLRSQVETLRSVATLEELRQEGRCGLRPDVGADDVAFLQYTSGSTGQPKGVVLTHANVLANLRTMGRVVGITSADVFVSWLPLYHDMGLIGAGMGSLLYAFPLVLMSPLAFLARPGRWLWALHRHRGTVSAGPNFAYELCLNKVSDAEIEGLDLSSWRLALNGAEAVSAETVRRFSERFAPYGLRASALMPVYGLAEGTLGAAFPPPGRGVVVDTIDRQSFIRAGRAEADVDSAEATLRFVGCGFPLPGHQLRIVDANDRELPERRVGHIQLQGPSSTQGYLRNPEATRALLHGDWLDSGDLGYIAGGELFVTGRAKDIIIRAGRNLSPVEIEAAVGGVEGVRKGCVAAFGVIDAKTATERLVVLAETREVDATRLDDLRREIGAVVSDVATTPPDDVVLAPPGSVLKTSSGKIRRSACRELYEQKKLGAGRPAVWRQIVRLGLAGVIPQLREARRTLLGVLYSAYVWCLMAVAGSATAVLALAVVGNRRRQRSVRRVARLLLRACGLPLRVHGLEQLPRDRAFILAANHSSYTDAVVVVAALPAGIRIVAKAELGRLWLARKILARIGVELVERFDAERGLADARRLGARLAAGHALFFFPEGTFTRMPGLLPFRMGAFTTAASARVPVVPVVLRGTRSLLRAGEWRTHRVALRVSVLEPIRVADDGWSGAVELRDQTRKALLDRLGEPDLATERQEGLERLRLRQQQTAS